MFVSETFEGAISDRDISEKSGFLDYIGQNDVVLADRGFKIHDLLAKKGATLVIPPFKTDGKLTKEQVIMTKIISKARIHVERYNERIKNFEILNKKIAWHLIPHISQILFVVCALVNFQEPLIDHPSSTRSIEELD